MRFVILLLALAPALRADDLEITIITRPIGPETINGIPRQFLGNEDDFVTRHVYYSKGALRREDFRGLVGETPIKPEHSLVPHMAVIENCETRDWLAVDLDAREYREGKINYPTALPALASATILRARRAASTMAGS